MASLNHKSSMPYGRPCVKCIILSLDVPKEAYKMIAL